MKLIALLVALALTGCATTSTPLIKVETQEVKVPVIQPYPPIEVIPHPTLEITRIDKSSPPGIVTQAYVITVQQLLDHIQQLEIQIKGVNDARQASPTTP